MAESMAECAICYESIPHEMVASLPCKCRLAYCQRCLHQALAAPMARGDLPRCPSCRAALTVKVEHGGHVYLSLAASGTGALLIRDLTHQTAVVQRRLLRQYGQDKPQCVCGGQLKQISLAERLRGLLEEHGLTVPPHIDITEEVAGSPLIQCKLCYQYLSGGMLWTCENGRRTVIHAHSHDVCEACFHMHVHENHDNSGHGAIFPTRARLGSESVQAATVGDVPDMAYLRHLHRGPSQPATLATWRPRPRAYAAEGDLEDPLQPATPATWRPRRPRAYAAEGDLEDMISAREMSESSDRDEAPMVSVRDHLEQFEREMSELSEENEAPSGAQNFMHFLSCM
eukprot:TRINITY_DN8188_c0_g1_i1.p1 TRINITY_DN8188_c0_g1~~TRINITY_DN8188_c0_g1_i1.p1  ORF type:complete len:342 (-),score=35.55 TRINITY_DN8188_c0_g1_i1:14-1039(-)